MNTQSERGAKSVLTQEHWREFNEEGMLRLRGAIPAECVSAMCSRLWDELGRKYQIRRDAPETWKEGNVFGLQNAGRSGAFADMACPVLCMALDELFAPEGWQRPKRWGSPLVKFPFHNRRWEVPNQAWHLDVYGELGVQQEFGEVTVFAFLDSVMSEGGATLAVTGTHRLIRDFAANGQLKVRSEDGRKMLAQADPWLKDLWSPEHTEARRRRLVQDGAVVNGVAVKAVEIIGEPGDIVIMHSSILHSSSPNCRAKPRLVLRQGIYRAGSTVAPPGYAERGRA